MAAIGLRDIVTDADRAAAVALRRAPGQEEFVASVEKSFADAAENMDARPRMWTLNDGDAVVGFVMLADGLPPEVLARNPAIPGPYFLWRLLIDAPLQRRGYGAAALDALVAYVQTRPGGTSLSLSCHPGDDGPQPFYERYGFVPTGEVMDGEIVMNLNLEARR
ncbi:MAG TPA: GNAT family N-acetyltransferase [Candidatus Limnocylindrales bacterium]